MGSIKMLLRYLRRFGIFSGTIIYIKVFITSPDNIRLPGIEHPFSLRPGTSDIDVFHQIFLNEQYKIRFATKPAVIIDGGANVGLFALAMKLVYPDVKIICVEPDIENYAMLKKNVEAYNDIFCENAGIWDKETKLRVVDKHHYGKWAMVVEEDADNGRINALTIDALMQKYNISQLDVLKLDIEASEKQVFKQHYENWMAKVKMIIIELHDCDEPGCARTFFNAVNKSYNNYAYSIAGENTVIVNNDLV